MKMLKNFAGGVFALWAAVAFVGTLLIIVIPVWLVSYLPEPKRTRYAFMFFKPWLTTFFILTGVRRVYKGREHFARDENYVVVCNHTSFMDVPLCSPGIPSPNKTIAKVEMSRIPVFGVIYKGGSVLVDRKNARSRQASFLKMKEVLRMGMHMCIYPEGTRNKTNEPLLRFQDGAFKLAIEAGKRIIPAVILNTKKVMPTGMKFYFMPHKVEMHFLPPVDVANKTPEALKEEVYNIMYDYLVQHDGAKMRKRNEEAVAC